MLERNFTGIDLYPTNVLKTEKNIKDAMEGRVTVKLANIVENIPVTNNTASSETLSNS